MYTYINFTRALTKPALQSISRSTERKRAEAKDCELFALDRMTDFPRGYVCRVRACRRAATKDDLSGTICVCSFSAMQEDFFFVYGEAYK